MPESKKHLNYRALNL